MDFEHRNNMKNKFVCPSDRQLALRAKLKAGWSSSKLTEPLRPDEQEAIISVIKRNEEIESAERQRVGRLVERVEKIKQHAANRGPNCCRVCGETFGVLRPSRIICDDCKKPMCSKCSVDISIRYQSCERTREVWLCRICSETREMWKKSGAWFFKGLPNYDVPSNVPATTIQQQLTNNSCRNNSSCLNTCNSKPTRMKRLTIRVNDSSSSSDAEDVNDGLTNNPRTVAHAIGNAAGSNATGMHVQQLQCGDNPRLRTFGSIRRERKLSNSFCNLQQATNLENNHIIDDNLSIEGRTMLLCQESNFKRRESASSAWSIGGDCTGAASFATTANKGAYTHLNQQCRDKLLGWLEIAIGYQESYETLDCTMVRARDLPAMDASGLTDPYCKLNIVGSDGNTKYAQWQRTKTVHKTRNPEFNETLQFAGIEAKELCNSMLYVAIFDDDKYGHDFLGAAKVCLSMVHSSNQFRMSVPLEIEDEYRNQAERSQEWPNGKVLLSLCYNTKKRALEVIVKQCINLLAMDNNGSSDPFVKIQLKPDMHKNKKYKTSIKWHTLNPIFNEEFHFEASPQELTKETLILTVWDKDFGKGNDFLGSLKIGYQSKGERLQQWNDCMRLPDQQHEKWHCLAAENAMY